MYHFLLYVVQQEMLGELKSCDYGGYNDAWSMVYRLIFGFSWRDNQKEIVLVSPLEFDVFYQ